MSSFIGLISTRTAMLLLLLGISFSTGYYWANTRTKIQNTKLRQHWTEQQLIAEREYQKQLARAYELRDRWQQYANALDVQLMEQAKAAQRTETKLRKEIRNAVAQDTNDDSCRTGIGAISLRLYREALGYENIEGAGHAASTRNATYPTHQATTAKQR